MHELDVDIHEALAYCARLHDAKKARFHAARLELKTLGDNLSPDVVRLVDLLGYWVRANLEWSFECGRYFGDRGTEIKETRVIHLRPKEAGERTEPSDGDESGNYCAPRVQR